MKNILVGVTGSVAAIKLPVIVEQLVGKGFEVQVVVTSSARHFLKDKRVDVKVWTDEDEWSMWNDRGGMRAIPSFVFPN